MGRKSIDDDIAYFLIHLTFAISDEVPLTSSSHESVYCQLYPEVLFVLYVPSRRYPW